MKPTEALAVLAMDDENPELKEMDPLFKVRFFEALAVLGLH